MHLEVIRMLVDALSDDTTGVNQQLETLPRDTADGNLEISPIVKFLDPTSDDPAALRSSQLDFPVIVVTADEPALADGMVHTLNVHHRQVDSMPISIRYITRNADSAASVAKALYTLRAIVKALRQWLQIDGNDPRRKRNDIGVVGCEQIRYGPVDEVVDEKDGITVLAAVRLELTVRDYAP